jgi:hypothetical protein
VLNEDSPILRATVRRIECRGLHHHDAPIFLGPPLCSELAKYKLGIEPKLESAIGFTVLSLNFVLIGSSASR